MLRRRRTEILTVLASAAVGGTLFYFAVYVQRTYGCALFLGAPFAMGLVGGALLSRRPTVGPAVVSAFSAAMTIALALLLMGNEGFICILLALPLAMLPLLAGTVLAYVIFRRCGPAARGMAAILALSVAGVMFAEPAALGGAPVLAVADSVVIDAPPGRVWSAIVGLDAVPSNDWVYRAGLACPQRTRIVTPAAGGQRVCTMSTGKLVEQIEVWEPNRRMRWHSLSVPPPMRELNPFHEGVDAPHLHGYYTSPRGEFVLEPLGAHRTRLTRRTWYSQRLYPSAYWRLWAELGISRIHRTVLEHVRTICS